MFSSFLPGRNQFPVAIHTNISLLFIDNHTHSSNSPFPRFVSPKCCSSSTNQITFTVNYLMNSCGLSSENAIIASNKINFETPDRPDSVLTLLKNHGFTKIQVSNLIRKRPSLLVADPEKTLLPKLDFFKSIGFSESDLAKSLSKYPTLLSRSLDEQIIPSYNFFKSVLDTDERVVTALKRTSYIFLWDHSKLIEPNIEFLRETGVPKKCMLLLLTHYPETMMQKHDDLVEIVKEVKEMGFDPEKSMFVLAVHALSGKVNKSTWDKCYEVYGRWGWSKNEILRAFQRNPQCMIMSEKKIMKGMDHLVNKMGWPARELVKCPAVLFFSLEKRIIPRSSVIQVLSSKGLLKKQLSPATVFIPVEKMFLEKFVTKYSEEVPELLSVYQGKIGVQEALSI